MEIISEVLAIIAPNRCSTCRFTTRGQALCYRCARHLRAELEHPFLGANICPRCTAAKVVGSPCTRCSRLATPWDTITAPWTFNGQLRAVLRQIKFGKSFKTLNSILPLLVPTLLEGIQRVIDQGTTYRLVAVPNSISSVIDRGFSTTAAIAAQLAQCSAQLELPALPIYRIPGQKLQSSLLPKKRSAHARNCWKLRSEIKVEGHYILIDDIATTGATLAYLSHLLKSAGAQQVHCLAVARATGFGRYWNRTIGPYQ